MHKRVLTRKAAAIGVLWIWAALGCSDSATPAGPTDSSTTAPSVATSPASTQPMAAAMAGTPAAAMPVRTTPPSTPAVAGMSAPGVSTPTAGAAPVATAGAGASGAVPDGAPSVAAGAGGSAAVGGSAGSMLGGAGSAAMAAAGSGAVTPREDLGKGDGKDVICIGDSWMLLSVTGIQTGLVKAAGQRYRTYGVPGTQLLNGQIPSQYTSAKREDPDIKTVVMTGGGNDLLLTGSTSGNAATSQIDKVAKRLGELWAEMGKDGVKDIVYVEYSRGGTNEKNVNEGVMKVRPVCEAVTPARCHFVDSDETIHMQLRDGIHPTDAGYDALGKTVYDLMVKEGMRR